MKRSCLALVLGLTALATAGCGGSDGSKTGDLKPFRDDWRVEAELPFPYFDGDGIPQITEIQIGGHEYNDNFANQGDVIVEFTGPADQIKVEMRRFTMATTEALAEEHFAALQLWAFNSNQSQPKKPADMDPMADCTASAWQNSCAIRVYYDGLSQLARAGADLRVTLPAEYRHSIDVVTDDSDDDDAYFNRGYVCVQNMNGSADVELENGEAFVILAEETPPIPVCTPAMVQACDEWTDADGNPAAWHNDCDCIAINQGEFGHTRVDSMDGASANITIDVPADLWLSATVENQGESQTASGDHCEASVEIPGFLVEDMSFPWKLRGTTPKPSEAATNGAGYSLQAFSTNCGPVAYTPSPDEYVGAGNGTDQPSEERGNIKVCAGCVRGQSCDQLIDG